MPPASETRDDSGAWGALACIALFIVTRCATLAMYRLRHILFISSDAAHYLSIARFIQENGHLAVEGSNANRQFPGLPFLIVAVDHIFHNLEVSGVVVAWGGSIASIALFHAMFKTFRLTAIYTIFVPSWIATSSRIMSEGCTFLLLLVAIKALQTERRRTQLLLLVISGYALVLRNTAVVFLVPFVVVWSVARRPISFPMLLLRAIAVAIPSAIYFSYNYFTIGVLTPQAKFQRQFFIEQAGAYYPHSLLTWPGHSLLLGLIRPGENWLKKMSVLASLALPIMACRTFLMDAKVGTTKEQRMAVALFAGTAAHLLFHLCIGGSFGYNSFDRYMSHINPVLAIGLFGNKQPRWIWIGALTVVGLAFAGMTGS